MSNWVGKQRRDYKLRRCGISCRLTDERYKLLNDIGFVWEVSKKEKVPLAQLPSPPTSIDCSSRDSRSKNCTSCSRESPPPCTRVPACRHLPPSNDVPSILSNHAMSNYAGLVEAAAFNKAQLKLAGLPGGVLALSIPAVNGISFIPVINHQGVSEVAPAPSLHEVASYHRISVPPHGPHLPPAYIPSPYGFHAAASHPLLDHVGAVVYHGRSGAANPQRQSTKVVQTTRPPTPANRGADPPEG